MAISSPAHDRSVRPASISNGLSPAARTARAMRLSRLASAWHRLRWLARQDRPGFAFIFLAVERLGQRPGQRSTSKQKPGPPTPMIGPAARPCSCGTRPSRSRPPAASSCRRPASPTGAKAAPILARQNRPPRSSAPSATAVAVQVADRCRSPYALGLESRCRSPISRLCA